MSEKFMFISDVHLTSKAPASRKETDEEYKQVQYNKLKCCYDYCNNNGINTVIFEGDIFNNSTELDSDQLNQIILLINSYENITSYTIIGNHDLYYRNESSDKMLLKTLLYSGTLKHLYKLETENTSIIGVDYAKPIPAITNTNKYNICVAHCFYDNEMFGKESENTNISYNKASLLGYNAYVLGHDHSYYKPIQESNFLVLRTGSLLRGTSKTDNLYRDIRVLIYDDLTHNWQELLVPCKEGKDAFIEERFIKKQHESFNMDSILSNLFYHEYSDVYEIINNDKQNGLEQYKDLYKNMIPLITQYLESQGLYDKVGE